MDFGKIDQPSMHDLSLYSNFRVRERESWLKHLKAKPAVHPHRLAKFRPTSAADIWFCLLIHKYRVHSSTASLLEKRGRAQDFRLASQVNSFPSHLFSTPLNAPTHLRLQEKAKPRTVAPTPQTNNSRLPEKTV